MHSDYLLRKQVRGELKKRRYIIYTLLILSLLYIAINLIFGDTGALRLMELKAKRDELHRGVAEIKKDNEELKMSVKSYKENDFYMEKHAREDFGLSKSDEYIFLYDR